MSSATESSRYLERPNFIVILVDEERYPPIYEHPEIREWRQQNLVTQQLLKSHSLEFHRHYIGTTACYPSRATLFTDHYPSLHGVSPIGENPRNSASSATIGLSGRDEVYGAETVELIQALDRQKNQNKNAPPWLLVSSLVNPHDIVLYGALTAHLPNFRFEVKPMPAIAPSPTQNESILGHSPSAISIILSFGVNSGYRM
ncbi:sulfatase-like hydrolase/transferase [Paenibacillus sp. FSL K6-0276]|uniref:sulfatase-like hydrolase/transferase n=1 Tax=Paenibacillus sp. FSL K6-0276 TaxID=2921450 RepID=UPI0030EE9DF0